MTDLEKLFLERHGWRIHPKYGKWYNPTLNDGAMYPDNPRAFRYICEDYNLPAMLKC